MDELTLSKMVLSAWKEILNEDVNLDSNLYEAGGSSLQLLLIGGIVIEAIGWQFPIAELAVDPTPRSMINAALQGQPGT